MNGKKVRMAFHDLAVQCRLALKCTIYLYVISKICFR